MEELQDLLLSRDNGIATITLNRPHQLNAISPAMTNGLVKLARELPEDPDLKVIVVTGAGRSFCAGGNVTSIASNVEANQSGRPSAPLRLTHPENNYQIAFTQCERPIIAAINGYAVGLGMGLALACDIRVASEEAQFFVAQTNIGRRPDGGLNFLLPRVVGVEKALELMWTGDRIDAYEAYRIGLVSKVVPAKDLMTEVMDLADRIAKGPTIAQMLAKRMVYKTMYPEEAQIASAEMEHYTGYVINMTEDALEGVRAFREKRKPVFKGR